MGKLRKVKILVEISTSVYFKAQHIPWTSLVNSGGGRTRWQNTQDITAASQTRGSFSRDNSPQKNTGEVSEMLKRDKNVK